MTDARLFRSVNYITNSYMPGDCCLKIYSRIVESRVHYEKFCQCLNSNLLLPSFLQQLLIDLCSTD